jgi:Ca2+:H+ antiporter
MPLHGPEYPPQPVNQPQSLANWRDNIPDEPFLKRIGERMSSRFLRDHIVQSPTTERHDPNPSGTNGAPKRFASASDGRLSSLGSSLTPEDSALFVRNVAEVAAAAATLAVHNSQSPNATPQPSPRMPPPPLSITGPSPKVSQRTPDRHHYLDHENADLAASGLGGHDAPNWSRTKSSMILLGATILYAIIAGKFPIFVCNSRNFGGYGGCSPWIWNY